MRRILGRVLPIGSEEYKIQWIQGGRSDPMGALQYDSVEPLHLTFASGV